MGLKLLRYFQRSALPCIKMAACISIRQTQIADAMRRGNAMGPALEERVKGKEDSQNTERLIGTQYSHYESCKLHQSRKHMFTPNLLTSELAQLRLLNFLSFGS